MSMSILGIQIDAIYHTSIVIGDREYYYGNGIHCSPPGRTHFGSPMEIMLLGFTSFSDDILQECIESMRAEYSPEAYDLFHHNCNNFTADFAMFLCGVSIPEKIKNLPQDVLNTPFGQFLRPTAGQQPLPITNNYQPESAPPATSGKVKNITSMAIFEQELKCAKCAVVFFTSAGCPPCRMVYPYFEELSSEHGEKATFIKVDVSVAQTIGSAYQITATPAFMSWCRGKKLDDWKGGSPTELKKYVAMLLNETYPCMLLLFFPHSILKLATY
jgi:thiol-disulfide isomerase/thioredoxin